MQASGRAGFVETLYTILLRAYDIALRNAIGVSDKIINQLVITNED